MANISYGNCNRIGEINAREGSTVNVKQSVYLPVTETKQTPHELPKPPKMFDRADVSGRFYRLIDEGTKIITIDGAPGVGKTTCLEKWANEVRDQYKDGQILVDAQRGCVDGIALPSDLQKDVLRSLSVDISGLEPRRVGAAYRTATSGKQLLIAIDNVVDQQDVSSLIPNSDSALVIAAGHRVQIEEGEPISIERFGIEESVDFLKEKSGISEEYWNANKSEIDEIARYSEGLPLLLEHAANMLGESDFHDPSEIAELMSSDDSSPLDALLNAELEVESESDRQLYCLLGRAGIFPIHLQAIKFAAAESPNCKIKCPKSLRSLERASLIKIVAGADGAKSNTIDMHAQVAAHAEYYISPDGDLTIRLLKALVLFYLAMSQEIDYRETPDRLRLAPRIGCKSSELVKAYCDMSPHAVFNEYEHEFRLAMKLALKLGMTSEAYAMAESLWVFFYENHMLVAGKDVFHDGLSAAQHIGNHDYAARMSSLVSRCCLLLGDVDGARSYLDIALKEVQSSNNYTLAGSVWEFKGSYFRKLNQSDDAIECYEKAKKQYDKTGDARHRGKTIANYLIAETYLCEGRIEASRATLGEINEDEPELDGDMRVKIGLLRAKGGADTKLDRETVRTGGPHAQQGGGGALPLREGGGHGPEGRGRLRGHRVLDGQEMGPRGAPTQLHRETV